MAVPIAHLRRQIVTEAASEAGYTEGKRNWNKFADELGATWVQNAAWCGTYVTAILRRAGIRLEKIISNPYYVPTMVREAKEKGVFSTSPEDGDVVLYDWQGQAWDGDHTGIANPSRGARAAWEGNTSPTNRGSQGNGGGVYLRHRTARQIIGYISLSKAAAKFPGAFGAAPSAFQPWEASNRVQGMRAAEVTSLQEKLQQFGLDLGRWGADGKYGKQTYEAVLAAQANLGVVKDGIAGPETVAALDRALAKSAPAKPAQAKPAAKPAPVALSVDGKLGPATAKRIQKWLGVKQDGVIGPDTIRAWQRGHRTPVDGRITGQGTAARPACPAIRRDCLVEGSGGSKLIRKVQAATGLKGSQVDGKLGPDTVKALQRHYNRVG